MNVTYKNYLIGLACSAFLILLAYFLVYLHLASGHQIFSHAFLDGSIFTLAIIQAVVQLRFFMHLSFKRDSSWDLVILISTLGIIFILVVGSIWIMNHLNYNMTPEQINRYISGQDGL